MGEVEGDRWELPGSRTHTHGILVEVLGRGRRRRTGQTSEAWEAWIHLECHGDIMLKLKWLFNLRRGEMPEILARIEARRQFRGSDMVQASKDRGMDEVEAGTWGTHGCWPEVSSLLGVRI